MPNQYTPRIPLETRFWQKVRKTPDCWEWTALCNAFGYGKIGAGGDHGPMLYAHRVSYELVHGPIPEGVCVLHKCDNPSCVNPEHLFLGSHADNVADKETKGRGNKAGIHNSMAKLTPEKVRAIRAAYVPYTNSFRQVAAQFGVKGSTVQSVINGRTWAHVK